MRYQSTPEPKEQTHAVSVVVCARDERGNLARNLPDILQQKYQTTHEVIVVNDNSVDDSSYILTDLQKQFRQLQVLELSQEAILIQGKKFPLSMGIKEAKHEVLLLTDADCLPASENWLYKMQSMFRPGIEMVLGYGAYQKLPGLLNKLIRFETFHTALQYFSYALAGKPYMGVGRNLAYRKELFLRNKGFSSINHIPSGDDDLFVNQVATKDNTVIMIDQDSFTFSEPKSTWGEWRLQKSRHYTTGKFYKASHKALLGLYTFSFSLFYPLFVLSLIFFDWRWALIVLVLRLLVVGLNWNNTMKKLGEGDLVRWFWLLDIWLFFYYIIFAPTVWKKPAKTWK